METTDTTHSDIPERTQLKNCRLLVARDTTHARDLEDPKYIRKAIRDGSLEVTNY